MIFKIWLLYSAVCISYFDFILIRDKMFLLVSDISSLSKLPGFEFLS